MSEEMRRFGNRPISDHSRPANDGSTVTPTGDTINSDTPSAAVDFAAAMASIPRIDPSDVIGNAAIEYAMHNWRVFPLNGKVPAIPKSMGGQGVLDASDDIDVIFSWWGGQYRGCNIGGRVPDSMVVLDVDPRHGGLDALNGHQQRHGQLPPTLYTRSGRGDGGGHYFYRRPPGKLSSKRLGAGLDIKTSSGYVVLPPSIHPDSGKPYERFDRPVAAPPDWLIELLVEPAPIITKTFGQKQYSGPSIADEYTRHATWPEILEPHGWRCLDADPDADGARWLHPAHTSACSATIRHGQLFVWSPNTPFEPTEAADPHGYTKFRAYAVLEHGGDLSAAARSVRRPGFTVVHPDTSRSSQLDSPQAARELVMQ